MTTEITFPIEDVKALFDLAVNSMDFGSGFLDDQEVTTLRRIAVKLDIDPMEATPSSFRTKYPHPFIPFQEPGYWKNPDHLGRPRPPYIPNCVTCYGEKTKECHNS